MHEYSLFTFHFFLHPTYGFVVCTSDDMLISLLFLFFISHVYF